LIEIFRRLNHRDRVVKNIDDVKSYQESIKRLKNVYISFVCLDDNFKQIHEKNLA